MSATTNALEVQVPPWLDGPAVAALHDRLAACGAARVVVLRGGADCFCRGLDLRAVLRSTDAALEAAVYDFARLLGRLRTIRRPLLAVVQGAAQGGGLGLAAACDVVLATAGASFSLPEALFGLTPALVGPLVTARVGAPAFRRLVLTAQAIGPAEARRIGLVDHDVAPEVLASTTTRMMRALQRTTAAAAWLPALPPDAAALQAAAAQTLARLRDPQVTARIAAFFDDGLAPWQQGGA